MTTRMSRAPRLCLTTVLAMALAALGGCGFFESTDVKVQRAEAQLTAGDFRGATAALKTLLEKSPDHARARLALAKVYLTIGDVPSAAEQVRKAGQADANTPEQRELYYQVLVSGGQFAELAKALEGDQA